MESVDKIVEIIAKDSGKTKEEIKVLIEEKKDELSGLVSEEGAAYIIGRELGVSLLKEGKKELKIKNLVDGLRGIEVHGRVMNLSDIREFERNGNKGRVMSVTIGDGTGVVRMPLWNQEIDVFNKLGIKEDDVVSVQGGWVKLDNRGSPELRLGRGKLVKSEKDIKVPDKIEVKKFTNVVRKNIKNISEGEYVEVRGCLVQLYKKDPFFDTCPECNTRVYEEDGKVRCKEHGIIEPQHQMVLSGVMDDGTGNIRTVFFREVAEELFGEKVSGLKQIADRGKNVLSIYDHFKGMGRDFIVQGKAKRNDFTESLELVVNKIMDMDISKEADLIIEKMK